ncbi:hypothetical protein evm_000769 [Chilo suppressalis]|nr:hypothetical protein evm_000769 [Chilo suppressalis]
MPHRKRKCLKRKKKKLTAHSFPKKKSKSTNSNGIDNESGNGTKRNSIIFNTASHKNVDKCGVNRLLSPFNKFGKFKKRLVNDKKRDMPLQTNNHPTGLSPKEKSYVICSCQTRTSRYLKLKDLASNAIKENKIFSVYGSCNAVRKALLERGWVEKIPPNRMNLTKIRNGTITSKSDIHGELERLLLSNLVEKYNPNFVWNVKEEHYEPPLIDMTKECNPVINKLRTYATWTTKQGLCSSMKRNYWFYIEDIAEVNGPRTYNSCDLGEVDEFAKDYKITACTSLLKWILSMVANNRPVFMESGKISMNVLVFALNRCKEYLFRKQHKDIDRCLVSASSGQWNAFLKKYYRIIAKQDVFKDDKENKLPLYLGYAKFLLKELYKFRPQLSCEGCHNIWIIKPAHCSRGRGIRMASKLAVITDLLNKANAKFVIQKYIEEPLLIHETKFDIRQYYLVTSTYPLVIWMYKDCYLKFSSQKYNLKNYHESIHLTNNAVQRKYKNCKERHAELPQSNMWHSETFKDYLLKIGKNKVWDNIIYPGMRKSITGIMLSCQDTLNVSKNRFELYGCDFILDKEYRPWLIEINSCPDLNHTTPVTGKICPAVVSDIIKVVVDYSSDTKSSTGKFECIYRQPISTPKYGTAADLFVRGYTLSSDYFYKGKIELKESYEDPDTDRENDIRTILSKSKQFYDQDVMISPEDDEERVSNEYESIEMVCCSHNTESENELDVAATVITEQLDEIIDRISSEKNLGNEAMNSNNKPGNSAVKNNLVLLDQIKSVTDINVFLKSTCKDFILNKVEAGFTFSKLDDRSQEHVERTSEAIISSDYDFNRKITETEILKASYKIINFIDRKEKEYLKRN